MSTRTLIHAAASGAVLGVASVPGPLGPLVFVGLVPLLGRLAGGIGVRQGLAAGFVTGLVFFAIGFGFIPFSLVSAGAAPPAAFLVGVPILATSVALFGALVAWIQRASIGLALAAAPSIWISLELVRSEEWVISVPWLHLAYSLGDRPALIQAASVAGVLGVSFWIVAVNSALVASFRTRHRARALAGAALLLLAPPTLFRTPEETSVGVPLRIAAVQPALEDAERRAAGSGDSALPTLLDLSERAVSGGADLVVWPESAYPLPQRGEGDAFLHVIANSIGAPILTGAWRIPPNSRLMRNAAFLADEDGTVQAASEKMHPVPVYERAPSGFLSEGLSSLGMWVGRFEPGDPYPPVRVRLADGSSVPIGVLVCIDASYPEIISRLRLQGARAYVQISNESATGKWAAGLHARVVRFRAVEVRAPFVRVANTGPTLWIDSSGRVVKRIEASEMGAATETITLAGSAPSAPRVGGRGVVVASLGLTAVWAAGCSVSRRRHRERSSDSQPRIQENPSCLDPDYRSC